MLAFVLSCVFLFICSMHLVLLGFAFTIRFQRFLLWISNSTTHFLKWKIYMMQNIFTRTKCGNEKSERNLFGGNRNWNLNAVTIFQDNCSCTKLSKIFDFNISIGIAYLWLKYLSPDWKNRKTNISWEWKIDRCI